MRASFTTLALTAQLAYVFGRLITRFRGLVMGWTRIVVFWLMGRVSESGGRWLAWMPGFHLRRRREPACVAGGDSGNYDKKEHLSSERFGGSESARETCRGS